MQEVKQINKFSGFTYTIILVLFLLACDHGIDPGKVDIVQKKNGISGTIYYQNWPPQDSLYNLKLVVYKDYPPENLMDEVVEYYPEIFSENLPYKVDSTTYIVELDTGQYEYIVVAQQYGEFIYFDWWVVGQYDTTLQDSIPTGITVLQDSIIPDINIFVDFDSVLFIP